MRSAGWFVSWVSASLAAASLAGCTRQAAEPVTHVAVVTDRSNSIERGDGSACRAVRRLVELVVQGREPFTDLHVRGGMSRIQVFGTPDAATPGVPRILADGFQVPSLAVGFEGLERKRRERDARIADLLDRVQEGCLRYATQENASPIYATVKAAVDWLRIQMAGDPNAQGLLVIQSDLVETYERPVASAVRALARGAGEPDSRSLRNTYGIGLEGRIAVYVCGVGLGTDFQQEGARARVVTLWRDALLLDPLWWRVESTCPGFGGLATGGGP